MRALALLFLISLCATHACDPAAATERAGGGKDAPSTQPLGIVEAHVDYAHDGLAGALRRDRSWGAGLGLVIVARPHRLRAGQLLDRFSLGFGAELGWVARVPTHSKSSALQPFDIAPTGYLFGGLRAELLGESDRLTIRYAIGATGDRSQARALYDSLGDVGGWSHAAEGEITQNVWLRWERHWLSAMETGNGTHLVDVSSETTTALGELRIAQTFAFTTRIGRLVGPLAGTTRGNATGGLEAVEAYAYATVGVDLVVRDAFIDDPLFNNGPHPYEVSAKAFVPHGTVGVVLEPWRGVRIGYALELRGRDTDVPSGSPTPPTHVIGRLEASVHF